MTQSESIDPELAKATVLRFMDARNRVDRQEISSFMTDDIELLPPPCLGFKGAIRGIEAVTNFLSGGNLRGQLRPATLVRTLKRITAADNVAILEQRGDAKTLHGQDYSNEYLWIYEFRGEKFCRIIEFADTLRAARIFGASAQL